MNSVKNYIWPVRTERLHEVVEVFAASELVTFSKKFADHDDRPKKNGFDEERKLSGV